MPDTTVEKSSLRQAMLAKRDALPVELRQEACEYIVKAIADLLLEVRGQCVAAYLPIGSEVDPRPILPVLASRGGVLGLPVVTEQGLIFREYRPGNRLEPAGFGTLGPDGGAAEVSPDILIVPMVAFDRRGHRLGYGKGYYDRAIAFLGRQRELHTIGLAFTQQEVEHIPQHSHDAMLNLIITQDEVIKIA